MYKGLTISIVIPCFNEEKGIAGVIKSIPRQVDEIIVVDNNSTDATAQIAKKNGAKVIKETKQGYGAAIKAGLARVKTDLVVAVDGDATYPINQTVAIINFMLKNKADFVSCDRFSKPANSMNWKNWLGNKVLTLATQILFGFPVRDSQSGMWVFRNAVVPFMKLTSDGMSLSEEIKLEAFRHPQISFWEYPIDYYARIGSSKLNLWRDGFGNLLFLFVKRLVF